MHPWQQIDLDVHERHASDHRSGRLRRPTDVTLEAPEAGPARVGMRALGRHEYRLPNGKTLVRQGFAPRS